MITLFDVSIYKKLDNYQGIMSSIVIKKQKTEKETEEEEEEILDIYKICKILGLFKNIISFLNLKAMHNVTISCFVKQLVNKHGMSWHYCINNWISRSSKLLHLYRTYKREFPPRIATEEDEAFTPTPIVCACENGRMDDVELFMNLHRFIKYIEIEYVNEKGMTLKEMVSQIGRKSDGLEVTPLMAAAFREDFHIAQHLIEQGEADPNIAQSYFGLTALHFAAGNNRTNTDLIQLLLNHVTGDSINKDASGRGATPLDSAYQLNHSPIRQEIIALLRSKGGKANYHDENGIEM